MPVLIDQDIGRASGYEFSLYLKTNGDLYSMGSNYWGQLGNGQGDFTSNFDSSTPVKIADGNVLL